MIRGQVCVSLFYTHACACQTELLVQSHSHGPVLGCLSHIATPFCLCLQSGFSFTFLSSTFACIP